MAVSEQRKLRKTRVGRVVSDKMDKTAVVAVIDNVRHPLYKKIVKRTVKLKHMMKQIAAPLEIRCKLWKLVLYLKTKDGEL